MLLSPHNTRHTIWHLPARRMSAALRYNHNSMDEMDEIRLRLRISKLEAKLTLAEIEATALTHEIASPRTPAPATKRLHTAMVHWQQRTRCVPSWTRCATRFPTSPATDEQASNERRGASGINGATVVPAFRHSSRCEGSL